MPPYFADRGRPVGGPIFGGQGRAPLYYDTERGRATVTATQDGEPYLEGADFGGPASSFKKLEPVFSGGGAPVAPGSPVVAKPTQRTLAERFTTTAEDQANRNITVAGATAAAPKGVYSLPGSDAVFSSVGTQAVKGERERRASYDAAAAADPWFRASGGLPGKVAAGATTLAGGLAGSLADPVNLLTAPINGGRGLLSQMLTQGGVNAGLDLPTQALDIASGVQDRYDPLQTAGSAGFGAAIPAAGRGLSVGAKAALDAGRMGGDLAARAVRAVADGFPDLGARKPPKGEPIFAGRGEPASPEVTSSPDQRAPAFAGRGRKIGPAYDPNALGDQLGPGPTVRAEPVGLKAADAEAAVRAAFPNATITSVKRSPEHNMKVGGAAHSFHLTGEAMDVVGVTRAQMHDFLKARGLPITELLDEGDHIHWAWGKKGGSAAAGAQPSPGAATQAPTREAATYLHPDGFPVTEPPASTPGDFIVRAEPDGTHTIINKVAGWSPVASGLDRDAALAQRNALEAQASQPPATAHDATLGEITDSLHAGQGNATLLENHDVKGFEAALAARGWQRSGAGEWTRPNGDSLFIRSQGDTARPIVQWKPGARAAAPTPEDAVGLPEPSVAAIQNAVPDITDQALNIIRSGGNVPVDQGPSLGAFLADNSPLAPHPDLTGMDAERWHRNRPFQRKLVREGGVDLETAAQRAHDAGYFNDVAPATMAGGDNMHPVTGDMLVAALRREFAGSPRYAREADPAAQDLAAHVDELEQMLHELGLDPATMSNAQIKAALDQHFSAPDSVREPTGYASEPVRLANGTADQGLIPGVGRPLAADLLRAEAARRGRRGGAEGLPAGGLWDETARGPDLLSGSNAGRVTKSASEAAGVSPSGVERRVSGQSVHFPDEAHASLYDFGQRLKRSAPDAELGAQADKLRKSIGRFMDWSEDLAREPGLAARFEGADGSIPPRKLIFRAARDYAAHIDREPASATISLYDPERTADLVREGTGVKLGMRQGTKAQRRAAMAEVWRKRRAQAAGASDKKAAVDLSAYGHAAGTPADARNTPRPGAVPSTDKVGKAAYAGQRLAAMADDLARSMSGTPVRQGRISLRKAAGEFDVKSGVVRTKAAQEIGVRAHELTHALEFTLKPPALLAALRKFADELKPLAYPGASPKELRVEGFAEFGRWYIVNPEHARKVAPNFYDAFEAALAKDAPAILKKWQAIQAEYQAYLHAPSTGVVAANVIRQPPNKLWGSEKLRRYFEQAKREGIPSTVQMIADEVWEERVDKFHFLNVALREARKVAADTLNRAVTPADKAKARANLEQLNNLKTVENPYRLGRMVGGAYSAGHMDIRHGVHPYHAIDPEGPSIPDALKAALGGKWNERGYDDFGAYLISKRMIHEWDRYKKGDLTNPPDMLSREAHAQAIKDFEASYPQFEAAAELAHEYASNLWKKRFDGGLITRDTYEAGLKDHADYVPAMRDVSDKARGGKGQVATGAGKFAGGAKRFKGSDRSFIHPIQSLMRQTYELNMLLARNDVLKALDDMAALAGPGGGAIVERVPATQLKAITVNASEAAKAAARDAGLSDIDTQNLAQTIEATLDDHLTGTIFRSQAMHEKGEPIVYVWRDGEKIPLRLPDGEFGKRMFESLSGMTPQMRSAVIDAFAMGSRMQRAGITTHPGFLIANYLRDQLSATMLTDVGYKPFASGLAGIGHEVIGTKTARRYNALGGIMGGMETSALGDIRPELNAKRVIAAPRHPKQLLSLQQLVRMTELSETGTRLGVFRNAYEKAKRAGLSDYEAGKEAVFQSRDYFDTDLHGSRMLVMRRIVPFLNAGIQGLSKAGRVATGEGNLHKIVAPIGKNAPRNAADRAALYRAYKLLALGSALGVWGLAQSQLYADDPEYQAFDVQERATNWFFKDANGRWLRYPKPFELAAGSNIAEGLYEAKAQHDPTAYRRMFQGLFDVLVPPTSIPWLTGAWEAARNKDYAGRPIVPDHLRGQVDPEMQYNSYTSELGKRIGHVLHASPALVDHWINTLFGSWGQEITGATRKHSGAALAPEDTPVLRRFTSAPERGSLDATEFYGEVAKDGGKLTQALGTFRMLTKDPTQDAKAIEYLNGLDERTRAYVVSQAFTSQGSGDLHPLTRAQNAVGVISDVRTDIREGRITDVRGRPIALSPSQLQQADKALARMGWEEMRNALVATGAPGWAQKKPVPVAPEMAKLAAINPALAQAVQVRMLEQKVLPEGLNQMVWGKVRPFWQAPIPDSQITGLLAAKRLSSTDATAKREEAMRLANGGQPAPLPQPRGLLAPHTAGTPMFAGGRR